MSKIARGKVRELLQMIGSIQDRVGYAMGLIDDDRSQTAHERARNLLMEAFDLCILARGDYEPIEEKDKVHANQP